VEVHGCSYLEAVADGQGRDDVATAVARVTLSWCGGGGVEPW
jgi:hypothetical protein